MLDIGRKSRQIPPALRRALEIRDGGCRWPGCGLRFIDGHHIESWALGGHTRLSNLISLCRTHHRAVHEEGFKVKLNADGTARFWDRTGWPLPDRPPPCRAGPNALERLIAENRKHGIDPDGIALARSLLRGGTARGSGGGPGTGSGDDEDPLTRAWEALDR